MRRILFIFVTCLVIYSCTFTPQTDLTLLLSKCDSLENQISALQHSNDSLSKIAKRWEYGRDSDLYLNDFPGGNTVSWRYVLSLEQLKFDESLFKQKDIDLSASSWYNYSSSCAAEVFDNIRLSETQQRFIVDPRFEADRYKYFASVVFVNAISEVVRSHAADLAKAENISNSLLGCVVDACEGLIYKKLYNKYKGDYNKASKEIVNLVKYYDILDL